MEGVEIDTKLKEIREQAELNAECCREAAEYLKSTGLKHLSTTEQSLVANAFAHGYYKGKKNGKH